MENIINKTMDRQDLESVSAKKIIDELNQLIIQLKKDDIKISSWYGKFNLSGEKDSIQMINRGVDYLPLPDCADDVNFPWFLYWEIVWLVLHSDFKPGQSVLDLGGSSSLFSYYLANKGMKVTTIDLQQDLVENANCMAKKMNWQLNNIAMDIRDLSIDNQFDHITSVCVFEHIPMYDRIQINKGIKRILKRSGNFSITFDYRNPSKAAKIDSPEEVEKQFVSASGLLPKGNMPFIDNGKNYLLQPFYSDKVSEYKQKCVERGEFDISELHKTKSENDYTFGALFLTNEG